MIHTLQPLVKNNPQLKLTFTLNRNHRHRRH